MKEVEVKVKKYKCENCGAIHAKKDNILQCHITGKEICTKCAKYLKDIEYYDEEIFPCRGINVEANLVNIDTWSTDLYLEKKYKLEEKFRKDIEELNTAYITGKL